MIQKEFSKTEKYSRKKQMLSCIHCLVGLYKFIVKWKCILCHTLYIFGYV